MELDDDVAYTPAELTHAVAPVDPDDPWNEPESIGEDDKPHDRGDDSESLSEFTE
jgi:hypothetical protein